MTWLAAKQRAHSPHLSFLRLVAVKLGPRHKLDQALSASDIASICMDENIDIPGLTPEMQTVEQGPMQIGRILGNLFKDHEELKFDEFKAVRSQERVKTENGNPQTLYKYSFSHAWCDSETKAAVPDKPIRNVTRPMKNALKQTHVSKSRKADEADHSESI